VLFRTRNTREEVQTRIGATQQPREAHQMKLSSLNHLAKLAPIIFGKAISYESITKADPHNGRPDFIDDKTEEMRAALDALKALQTLHETDPVYAKILYVVHVVWGVNARVLKDNWVDLARQLRSTPPTKNSATLRHKLYCEAVQLHHLALQRWEKL
jgi:hypothetical protein